MDEKEFAEFLKECLLATEEQAAHFSELRGHKATVHHGWPSVKVNLKDGTEYYLVVIKTK